MRPPDPAPVTVDQAYVAELHAIAESHGITRTGVCDAAPLHRAREEMRRRQDAGLHDEMQFTYKNIDRSTDPARAVRDAASIFVGARPYWDDDDPAPVPGEEVAGRVARYSWQDHYAPLRRGLWAVAQRLRADGWKAVPFADDNSVVDREVAHRAGIGWFGKNANLLLPGAGSWFVLGSVVTNAPLPPAPSPVPDGCGGCHRCIDQCPTQAIVADGVIDAGRCLAWVLQKPGIIDERWRAAVGDRIYGCDECQLACPPSVRFGRAHRAPANTTVEGPHPADPVVERWLPVLRLLDADDDTVADIWGTRYLADRDPRWVRRNALVVLGNVGDGARDEVRAVVRRYLADADPVLRAHAVWSARRLGLQHMLPATDPHPLVAAELAADRRVDRVTETATA